MKWRCQPFMYLPLQTSRTIKTFQMVSETLSCSSWSTAGTGGRLCPTNNEFCPKITEVELFLVDCAGQSCIDSWHDFWPRVMFWIGGKLIQKMQWRSLNDCVTPKVAQRYLNDRQKFKTAWAVEGWMNLCAAQIDSVTFPKKTVQDTANFHDDHFQLVSEMSDSYLMYWTCARHQPSSSSSSSLKSPGCWSGISSFGFLRRVPSRVGWRRSLLLLLQVMEQFNICIWFAQTCRVNFVLRPPHHPDASGESKSVLETV